MCVKPAICHAGKNFQITYAGGRGSIHQSVANEATDVLERIVPASSFHVLRQWHGAKLRTPKVETVESRIMRFR